MRGVLYLVWGSRLDALLERSIASLRQFHPDLPVHVHRGLDSPNPWQGLLQKSAMAQISPYSQTLYLDADTVILGNLDYGFEMAAQHGLACTHCESPWARRHTGLASKGDLTEFNTGVLFFSQKSRPLFDAWEKLAPTLDSSTIFLLSNGQRDKQDHDDQASFAAAVHETGFVPFVLPLNWNFRPKFFRTFFGPLKIWHDYYDVPLDIKKLCQNYQNPNSIIQFHEIAKIHR
jgi:hypothetical protein